MIKIYKRFNTDDEIIQHYSIRAIDMLKKRILKFCKNRKNKKEIKDFLISKSFVKRKKGKYVVDDDIETNLRDNYILISWERFHTMDPITTDANIIKALIKIFDYNFLDDKVIIDKENNKISRERNPDENRVVRYNDGFRHKLLLSLEVSVCPYCNRNYTTAYSTMTEGISRKKTTSTLDHFFPREKYPEYSLAIFNFVPSCVVCNSIMKQGENGYCVEDGKVKQLLYPFPSAEDEFKNLTGGFGDDCIFVLKEIEYPIPQLDDADAEYNRIICGNANNLMLDLKVNGTCNNQKKIAIELNKKIFKLIELYEACVEEAKRFRIQRRTLLEPSVRESLNKTYDDIGLDRATETVFEINTFGFDWNEDHVDPQKPLSKLAYDMIKRPIE